jgi:hypothetical protein
LLKFSIDCLKEYLTDDITNEWIPTELWGHILYELCYYMKSPLLVWSYYTDRLWKFVINN